MSVTEVDSPQDKETREELCRLQLQDETQAWYVNYLEQGSIPNSDPMARNVLLGSKNYEMIDGPLHHEDPTCPGRWRLV